MIYISIDIGVNTGFAVYDKIRKEFLEISCTDIDTAYENLKWYNEHYSIKEVIIEDVAKIGGSKYKAQGAGSIKRDLSIWKMRIERLGLTLRLVRPSKNSLIKLDSDTFKRLTGWQGRTNQHSRDAAGYLIGI